MKPAPIILVPGFWLGAWAWDEVADLLRRDGHDVTALTLPGLESRESDRSNVHAIDHVDTIVRAIETAPAPPVLVVHSATASPAMQQPIGCPTESPRWSTSIRHPARARSIPSFRTWRSH